SLKKVWFRMRLRMTGSHARNAWRNVKRILKGDFRNNTDLFVYLFGSRSITYLNQRHEKRVLRLFERYQIDIDNDIVEFPEFRCPNFFNDDYSRIGMIHGSLDILFPAAFNVILSDTEGPCELGEVRLEKQDVVFDCGANLGLFSAVAAGRGCTVYAFEPVSKTIPYLRKTGALYPERIHIVQTALSNTCGKARITDNFLVSTIMPERQTTDDSMAEVDVITMDEYVHRNQIRKVDFIKADIEGAERLMLEGAKETLRVFSPKLSICSYHFPDDPKVLENLIKQANPKYRIIHKYSKLYAYVP
ncbi:MAG TPA: FkbM family methyltransferase, partial [Thermotogota bacterium]|nr:FkbM family methyltransferase [Thermotogota bacterium]